jgi:concanavalin A-like lectin/glucanase superfamily protein
VINISGGKITRGQWNQLAATYNGKEAVAFINGEPVVRDLVEGPIDYTGVENLFEVGFAENGNLDGEMAALEIFDHALSNSVVLGNWQAGKSILLGPEEITA